MDDLPETDESAKLESEKKVMDVKWNSQNGQWYQYPSVWELGEMMTYLWLKCKARTTVLSIKMHEVNS